MPTPFWKLQVCTQTWRPTVIPSSRGQPCVEELTQISKLWWYNQHRSGADILWLSLCSSTYPDRWGTWVHCAGSGVTRLSPDRLWWPPVRYKQVDMMEDEKRHVLADTSYCWKTLILTHDPLKNFKKSDGCDDRHLTFFLTIHDPTI